MIRPIGGVAAALTILQLLPVAATWPSGPLPLEAQDTPAAGAARLSGHESRADEAAPTDAPTTTIVAGPRYEAGPLRGWLLGDGYREVWLVAIEVPLLDIGSVGGGLTPVEQGGGNQSITLHFETADGHQYIFRSVDKHLDQGYPPDLEETLAGDQIQDVISALYPASALAVGELLDPTGILHVDAELYVMPDDLRLGEYRETFAGMLGTLELIPNEGPNDEPFFAGSNKIKGTEEFLIDMDSTSMHRLNTRRYLKARLFDFVVNDSDRGGDQWRWARYATDEGYLWEPIPRDRDWAFVHAEGALVKLATSVYPKAVEFDPEFPDTEGLTLGAWELDRRLLSNVGWEAWAELVRELQDELTDEVIADAILAFPEPWHVRSADRIEEAMRARRDGLLDFARDYYELLAHEPRIVATFDDERAEVTRLEAGGVRVTVRRADVEDPYFDRVFSANETHEVRLYMREGDDRVVVRGPEVEGAVLVRVVGGEGNDRLIDQTTSVIPAVQTTFYDAHGDNQVEAGEAVAVSHRDYRPPQLEDTFVQRRLLSEPRDWGGDAWFAPHFEYGDASGVVLGASWNLERYGFRAQPYRYRAEATVMYGTESGNFGMDLDWSSRFADGSAGLDVGVRAVQFGSFRFFGYGNETARPANAADVTLVEQDQVEAGVLGRLEVGPLAIGVGPFIRYTDSRPPEASPLAVGGAVGRLGGRVDLVLDRAPGEAGTWGYVVQARAEGLPAAWDLPEPIGSLEMSGGLSVPLPLLPAVEPTLGLRAGGRHVWGEVFPVDESAFVGGSSSLRGVRYNRFAGRTAAFAGAELRAELFELELFTRGRLGAFGFQDVGRVWWDETGSERWHEGHGVGLWYETLGFVVRASVARGEQTRYYADLELPF